MRINSVNNNNYQTPRSQQSFGAIRGTGMIKREDIGHLFRYERLIQGISFDEWFTSNMERCYPNADALEKLINAQAKLAKKGEDFNSKFDELTITSPQGEVIHPIINYKEDMTNESITATIDNVNYGKCLINGKSCYEIETVFSIIKEAVDDLAYRLINTPECFAKKLEQAKLRMGIRPQKPTRELEQGTYKNFAELSGIPEEQAQAFLLTLINKLKTPNGKTATTQELLETMQQAGLIQPRLTEAEQSAIEEEVETILPTVADGEIREI